MSLTLASIEERIKSYEQAIMQSLANHQAMVGAMQELKNLLAIAEPIAEVVAPSVAPVLDEIGHVVDAVDSAVEAEA